MYNEPFESIGKKTPYRVPEGFFEALPDQVASRVDEAPKKPLPRVHVPFRRLIVSAAAAAACLAVALFVFNGKRTADPVCHHIASEQAFDRVLHNLSGDQLEELMIQVQCDPTDFSF